jgi:hypothetical protein
MTKTTAKLDEETILEDGQTDDLDTCWNAAAVRFSKASVDPLLQRLQIST